MKVQRVFLAIMLVLALVENLQREALSPLDEAEGYRTLQEQFGLTQDEIASMLGICTSTVKRWRKSGLLRAHAYNEKPQFLYEHPGDTPPVKSQGLKLADRRRLVSNPTPEVQYGT